MCDNRRPTKNADGQSAQGRLSQNNLKLRRNNAPEHAGYPANNRRSVADHSTSRAARQALTVASKSAGSSSYQVVPPDY
jgi:hypothetical protein